MTISYPLSWPTTPGPKRVEFASTQQVGLARSPFTLQAQVQEYQGDMWTATVTLPVMQRESAEEWHAFLLSLHGVRGTFYLYDPLGREPRGIATGSPLVKGGSQSGYTLATEGWSVSTTNVLKKGDWIQIGSYLYKVVNDHSSDGSGEATLDIWPSLRVSPADNDAIITSNAKGVFRLAENVNPIQAADELQVYEVSFSAVEAR